MKGTGTTPFLFGCPSMSPPICGEKSKASGLRQLAGAPVLAHWVRARPGFARRLGWNARLASVTLCGTVES